MLRKQSLLRIALALTLALILLPGTVSPAFAATALPRPTLPENGMVSAGILYTAYLSPDGRVVASDRELPESDWTDIVAIDAGFSDLIGLKADGTVISTDKDLRLSGWKDIVAVSAGQGYALGLKANGTVVAAGKNSEGQCKTSRWKNIVAISAGMKHAVGLRADGTVVSTGDNSFGQCDVSDWTDIIQVSTCYCYTIGLKKDGTVIVAGSPELESDIGPKGQLSWTDMEAVTAGMYTVYGLRSDGTVHLFTTQATSNPSSPQLQLNWDLPIEIMSFDAGYHHLACMDYYGDLYFRGGGQSGESDACRLLRERGCHTLQNSGSGYQCLVCGYCPALSGQSLNCSHVYSKLQDHHTADSRTFVCNRCGDSDIVPKKYTYNLADRLVSSDPDTSDILAFGGDYTPNGVFAGDSSWDYTGVPLYGAHFFSDGPDAVGIFDVSGSDILDFELVAGSAFDPGAQAQLVFYADDVPILILMDITHETELKMSLPIYNVEKLTVSCVNIAYAPAGQTAPRVHIILDGDVLAS